MNLFSSNQPQQSLYPQNNYQMPFGNQSGTNQFNRPNSAGAGSFSNNPLTGANSLFTQTGSNNLFGNNSMGGNNQGGGGGGGPVWGQNQNQNTSNNNNLFSRGNTMPASLFPGPSTQNNTQGNMFQTNQSNSNNNLFRSNSMIGSGTGGTGFTGMGNNNPMSNQSSTNYSNNLFNTGNRYNTRSSVANNFDKGTINNKYIPKKNGDGLLVCCVTYDKDCKKSLEELRLEDYSFIKANQIPDHIRMIIQKNMQGLDGNSNSVMIGSSSNNNMFNTQGGMGGGNTMGMGGSNNNLFGSNNNRSNWPSIGTGTNNNLFQSNNNNMGSSGNNNLFSMGGNQGGMGNQPNMNPNNNLFSQQGQGGNQNPNFFNQNQNAMGGGMMNQPNNPMSNNNLFASNAQNRFQTQSSMFPQNNLNNQMGSSFPNAGQNSGMNPFQNRSGPNFLPNNNLNSNNNLFQNKIGNQSAFPQQNPGLFPQQGQMQQPGFFPNQNQMGMNPNQFSLSGQNPHLFPPGSQQMGGMTGQPSLLGQFYQNFSHQGFIHSQDGMGNPHLFPYQPGQLHFQQPNMPGYFPNQQMPNSMNPYGVPSLNPTLNFDKLQNSLYTPYQDDKSQSYAPRNTLNDVASNLEHKLTKEPISPKRNHPYLPYNPFERRTGRRMEIGSERETVRNSALQWQSLNHSLARRQDDTFTLIKKSKYVEDDIEIIMRPKPIIPHNRNRSSSPAYRKRSYSPMSNHSRDNLDAHAKGGPRNIYNSTIRVNIAVKTGADVLKNIEVRIFQKAKCLDLKMKALEMLRSMGVLRAEISDSVSSMDEITFQAALSFNNRPIGNDMDLEQMKIGDNCNCTIEIPNECVNPGLLEEIKRSQQPPFDAGNIEISSFTKESEQNYPASRHAPKLTNSDYKIQPTIEQLNRMTDRELAAVEGFTIWNNHGKVEFEGRTDVRDINLDEVVVINNKNVEIYPEDKFKGSDKPFPGEKLNKPALITLYNCFSTKRKNQKAYEEKAREKGYEFIDYDEKNGVYRIRVTHF